MEPPGKRKNSEMALLIPLQEAARPKYPSSIEGIRMPFLILGMQGGAEKILDGIKDRTGSNANPISLQVIKGIMDVSKALMPKSALKGQAALDLFLKVALKEFNTDAPFISGLFRKYKLDSWAYN